MRPIFHVAADADYVRLTLNQLNSLDLECPPLGFPTTQENILRWEKSGRAIYRGALMYRICIDMGLGNAALQAHRQSILRTLRDWPHWRPEGEQDFDWNNWANGYLPGAWGLLGGDPQIFHERGTAYIRQIPRLRHWLRRSTNHGIVILATYLIGARSIGAEPEGRELLRRIIAGSLYEGCYIEGIAYLNFVIGEVGPYLAATWDGKTPWRDHVAAELPGIELAKTMIRLGTGNSGQFRATFGDVNRLKFFRHRLAIADSLSGEGTLNISHQIHADDHLRPLTRNLPSGGSPTENDEDRVFPMGVATARTERWAVWIIGSKLHLTHNAQHDCGSFFFERGDLVVGEQTGREAFKHNVPLLADAPGYPDCAGPQPFARRNSSGHLQPLGKWSWRVICPPSFDGCPSRITAHVRDFHIVDDCLVVLDRLNVDGDGRPVVQFHTSELASLFGHDLHKGRALCAMDRDGDGGWVSASVIGASDPLAIHDGRLSFRGRHLAFPPLAEQKIAASAKRKSGLRSTLARWMSR